MNNLTHEFALCDIDVDEKLITQTVEDESSEENAKEAGIETIETFNTIVKKNDILQNYLKDIGRIKLLKTSEEQELGKKIKEGKSKEAQIAPIFLGKGFTGPFPCPAMTISAKCIIFLCCSS